MTKITELRSSWSVFHLRCATVQQWSLFIIFIRQGYHKFRDIHEQILIISPILYLYALDEEYTKDCGWIIMRLFCLWIVFVQWIPCTFQAGNSAAIYLSNINCPSSYYMNNCEIKQLGSIRRTPIKLMHDYNYLPSSSNITTKSLDKRQIILNYMIQSFFSS